MKLEQHELSAAFPAMSDYEWLGTRESGGRMMIARLFPSKRHPGYIHYDVTDLVDLWESINPVIPSMALIGLDSLLECLNLRVGDFERSQMECAPHDRSDPFVEGEGAVEPDDAPNEVVYFLRAGPFVKIGRTISLDERLKALQTGCPFPIHVHATVPGGSKLERILHIRFARLRRYGEWFSFTEEIEAHVAELKASAA